MSAAERESIDSILNPQPQEETHHEENEGAEETGEVTQVAAETQKEEVKPVEAAKPVEHDAEGIKAAMIAERKKRQETEAELAAMKEAAKVAAEEQKPFLGEEYEQRFTETEQRFQNQLIAQKLDMSEAFARDKYADFEEKLEVFKGLIANDPGLYSRMVAQTNPAEFAYKAATDSQRLVKLQELGDPAEYEAKLREKIKAELAEEAKSAELEKTEAAIRSKLAKGGFSEVRSAGAERTTKNFTGPTSLGSILGKT